MQNIYVHTATSIRGKEISISEYKDNVLLIVNTASKCGLTPQYKELEELHQKYKDQGLVILGFPCNQFGHQEPGAEDEISTFCEINFGVTFQMMSKVNVNGNDAHPLYQYLKNHSNSGLLKLIKWNFTKFLVAKDGTEIKRYAPTTSPLKLEEDIKAFLSTT